MMYKGGKIWKEVVQVEAEDRKENTDFNGKLYFSTQTVLGLPIELAGTPLSLKFIEHKFNYDVRIQNCVSQENLRNLFLKYLLL